MRINSTIGPLPGVIKVMFVEATTSIRSTNCFCFIVTGVAFAMQPNNEVPLNFPRDGNEFRNVIVKHNIPTYEYSYNGEPDYGRH
jgi:hypothetical protein